MGGAGWQRAGRAAVFCAALAALCAVQAPAQTAPPQPSSTSRPPDRASRETELRAIEDTLSASAEQRRKIEAEIDGLKADRARLNAALIDTANRVRASEGRVSAVEKRLDVLTGTEDAIKRSLQSRRGVVAEVLASLQRMGRKPPPAVLVRPDDMLAAVRTAMLLGAVLPELRAETEALASDLGELIQLRVSIQGERDGLTRDLTALAGERQRLAALIKARQSTLADAEMALGAERERSGELAKQAASLKDLIAGMERESAAARRALEEARKADEAQKKAAELDAASVRNKVAAGIFKDAARLAPAVPFAEARGQLPSPVSGALVKSFGAADGFGGSEKGLSFATLARAQVASPTDGWVSYAGPYRTYGQLLIINAGGGYYIVLAGMARINVEAGQFVLAGEPVAVMGETSGKTAAAIVIGATQPILYVEFRKDGSAIDPGPWWAKPETQKVSG